MGQYELPRYDGPAARLVAKEMSKAKYETNKYKLKKDPKVEQISKFSTFPEAYAKNIEQFQKNKKKNPKNSEQIEQDEIEYLLNTIPFVKEYGLETCVINEKEKEDDDEAEIFNVRSMNTNKNTFNKYLWHVEKVVNSETALAVTEAMTPDDMATCKCGGYLEHHAAEAALICDKCGEVQAYVESTTLFDKTADGMAYKRINHLTECLNALQGKEGTSVPQEVIEAVRAEFKKNRISSTSEIKPSKVKQYLKKLGYSSYYENIHTIANGISGVPTLKLSLELEKRFKDMFVQIQDPFFRHKPEKRKNFLSYNYVLYKFSELLGEDDLLPFFTLLKCQKNLHAQDQIWKKICEDLRWEFISTT
jgi:hypothetical protein